MDSRHTSRTLLSLLVAGALLVCGSATWGQAPASTSELNFAFVASDGVEIGATLYKPVRAGTYPAIILAHGFGQGRFEDQGQTRGAKASDATSIPSEARRYARDGYIVLAVDSRYQKLLDPKQPDRPDDDIFLKPGGFAGLNNSREIQDHIEQIDWLVNDPQKMIAPARVRPARIGMSGYSYEANQTLLTAAHDSRLRAIAVLSGWTDYLTVKFPGLSGLQRGVAEFAQLAAPLVSADFSDNDGAGNIDPAWFEVFLQSTEQRLDLLDAWFRKASLSWQPYRLQTPIFLAQAWNEFLIPADQAIDLFRKITVPKRLYIGGWGHFPTEASLEEGIYVLGQRKKFFDHWLKDDANDIMSVPVEFAQIPWSANKRTGKQLGTEKFQRLPLDRVQYRRLYLRNGNRLALDPPAETESPDLISRKPDAQLADLFVRMKQEIADGLQGKLTPASVASLRKLFALGQPYSWSAELPPWAASVTYQTEPLTEDMRLLGTSYLDIVVENNKLDPVKHNNILSVRLMTSGPGVEDVALPKTRAGEVLVSYGFYQMEKVESRTRPARPQYLHVSIPIMPVNTTLKRGSRIIIKINGCDFPNTFPCLDASETRIHHSPARLGNEGFEAGYPAISYLALPVFAAN